MLKIFPLRRSFSLDLAPDDSNPNFLLNSNDDSNIGSQVVTAHVDPHILSSTASHHVSLHNKSVIVLLEFRWTGVVVVEQDSSLTGPRNSILERS